MRGRRPVTAYAKNSAPRARGGRTITAAGATLTIAQWVARTGLSNDVIRKRLAKGWNEEEAVTRPLLNQRERAARRTPPVITAGGATLSLKQWAAHLGCTAAAIRKRLHLGWDPASAVLTPVVSVGERARRGAAAAARAREQRRGPQATPPKQRTHKPALAPAATPPPTAAPAAPAPLGFVQRSSLRRDDCDHYRSCLYQAAREPGRSGCPASCAGYQADDRRPQLAQLAVAQPRAGAWLAGAG